MNDDAELAKRSPTKFVRFRRVLVGRGSTALDMHVSTDPKGNPNHMYSVWAHMCGPYPWREVRALGYHNNGVVHKPAGMLPPLVLIMDGKPSEKRPFVNAQEMANALKGELPGVEVRWELMSDMTGVERNCVLLTYKPVCCGHEPHECICVDDFAAILSSGTFVTHGTGIYDSIKGMCACL